MDHFLAKHKIETAVIIILIAIFVGFMVGRTTAQGQTTLACFDPGETKAPPCEAGVTVTGGLDPNTSEFLGWNGGGVDCLCTVKTLNTKDEGSSLVTNTTSYDFTGDGVTATNSGSAVTVSIPGGGGGGAFVTTSNITSNLSGDLMNDSFVFGSFLLNDVGDSIYDARFYFYKTGEPGLFGAKSAFRAGTVTGSQWDIDDTNTNVGDYSAAMGSDTIASGLASFAMGRATTASGDYSTAIGESTTARASNSFVMGRFNEISGTIASWIEAEPLFVIGNGVDDTNRSNAMTVLKGGNVGIGTVSPSEPLHIKTPDQMADEGLIIEKTGSGSPRLTLRDTSRESTISFEDSGMTDSLIFGVDSVPTLLTLEEDRVEGRATINSILRLVPRTSPPSGGFAPALLGDIYIDDSHAFCVFIDGTWTKIVGSGSCS